MSLTEKIAFLARFYNKFGDFVRNADQSDPILYSLSELKQSYDALKCSEYYSRELVPHNPYSDITRDHIVEVSYCLANEWCSVFGHDLSAKE